MPVFLLLFFLLLLSDCSSPTKQTVGQDQAPAGKIVLRGGTLIDGTGKGPVENATVVIAGNRFEVILSGDASQYESEPNTRVIDVE